MLDQLDSNCPKLGTTEINGAVHEDLVLLKDLYVRCQNEVQRREAP